MCMIRRIRGHSCWISCALAGRKSISERRALRLLENEAAGKGRLRGGRETAKAQALQGHGADLPSFFMGLRICAGRAKKTCNGIWN